MTLHKASFLRINLLASSRFGECLRIVQDHLDAKNYYAFNPSFDKCCNPPDVVKTPTVVPVPAAQKIPSPCGNGTTTGCMAQACAEEKASDCTAPNPCCNAKPCAPVMPGCGCAQKSCAPAMPGCNCAQKPCAPMMPGCGCNTKQACNCQDQILTPCDTAATLPATDYQPCGPMAAPYMPPYNKRPNRSCGCG